MVGESPAILGVLRLIAKVGPSDSTVLLLGESGTGKELAARAIHRASPRANKPFVPINCATLTENLLESELFGHERGAFTGAIGRKIGKIELAEGGTVFLDEIAELAPALQARLLRLLQEHEFERVGGTRPIRVDVRFVAQHPDLHQDAGRRPLPELADALQDALIDTSTQVREGWWCNMVQFGVIWPHGHG
jgi:transcriptional regulator with GAF, ATPase, and Fis domain